MSAARRFDRQYAELSDKRPMRSLDDLWAASKWASALSAGQLQRARTTTIVRELGLGKLCMPQGRSVQCVDRRD